jgi:FMN phosphatase YigB (HAD superfamily)
MAKQILNEEFQRMQKLAGIQLNESEINYDDENFSDPMIYEYDNTFLDSDFKSSSDYHEYNDVLEIIKSLKNKKILGFDAEDVLEDFKSTFIGEKISKENYLEFINEYLPDEIKKSYLNKWIELEN